MEKLMTKENLLTVGLFAAAFLGVRYIMKSQNEPKSNAWGNPRVPCSNPTSMTTTGNPKDPCCTGTDDCSGAAFMSRRSYIGR